MRRLSALIARYLAVVGMRSDEGEREGGRESGNKS